MRLTAIACTLSLAALLAYAADEAPALFKTDFEGDDIFTVWKTTEPAAWKISDGKTGKGLELLRKSNYAPKVRSPHSYALIENVEVTDFQLDVDVKSTAKDYGHRSLCFFFGFQDPEHFYYCHLAKAADPHAHSIFLVNGAPRLSIVKDGDRTQGVVWTDGWHHVRIKRDVASGSIDVYFDDMTKPIIHAVDKTFTWGKVGLGSFDDKGIFDDFTLRGTAKSG